LTSSELPARISTHAAHSPHGSAVGPFSQFKHRARILAAVVLPTPRIPVNKNACAIRPRFSASPSVRVTCSWPTSSEKRSGRHLRASTRCGVWDSAIARSFSLGTARRMIARHPCGTGWQPVPLLPSGPGGVRGLPLRRTRLSAAGSPENLLQRAFLCAPYYNITAPLMQPPMTKMFRARCNSIVSPDGVRRARLLSQLSWHLPLTRSPSASSR